MNLLERIKKDISKVPNRKTKGYRDIAKAYKKEIKSLNLDEIYKLCETLLETRSWGETTIAYQVIFDNKKMFNEDTFDIFEKWLYQYIEDWWDCDDFMTHAFQYLLMQYPKQLNRVKSWVSHEKFAVRRSAAVILIRPAQKGLLDIKDIITISELLIDDPHYLVQKGVGWLLKESTKYYHDEVVQYLEHNVKKMTRTTFRYALEKLPKEEKEQLMFL